MSDTIDSEPEGRRAAAHGTAGALLKAAREARGLAVESVARELHWPLETVAALERDDYAKLPPAAFVRGYIRSYARLLELPEQEPIAAYDRAAGAAKAPELYPSVSSPGEGKPLSWRGPAGLIVAGLLGIWVYQQWMSFEIPVPLQGPAELAGQGTAQVESPTETAEAGTAAELPASTPLPLPSTPPVPAPAAVPEEPSHVPDPAASLPAAEPAPVGVDTLVLNFAGESWAGVIDADGKKLLFQTMAKGQVASVQGKAPFKITLGRPADTRIEYNGQLYDHGYTSNRSSVRFTVPKAAR
ncbi:MAG: DUF4115 domain-containing protein [Methylococcus sp.]|nr:DUF4115 domain-containing protein [Methylococcus sp.]